MKKKVLFLTLFLSVFISGIALGSSQWGQYKGREIVHLTSGGKELTVTDVPAQIVDDRTLVPLYMLRQAGFQVTWSPDYTVDVKAAHQYTQAEMDQISKSVAKIYVYDANDIAVSQGSGFIINDNNNGKLLITNDHVGAKGPKMRVEVNGEVIGLTNATLFDNPQTDVWGAKITTNAPALPYQKDISLEGTVVTAIGYPSAKLQTANGVVNKVEPIEGETMLTHNATLDHGSSGGVLLDDKFEAIGITTGGYDGTDKNESTPLYYVQQELDKLH